MTLANRVHDVWFAMTRRAIYEWLDNNDALIEAADMADPDWPAHYAGDEYGPLDALDLDELRALMSENFVYLAGVHPDE